MSETLETLLNSLCSSVQQGTQSNQQMLYTLSDAKEAKLAYDVLVSCGVESKYYPDESGHSAKLYVTPASLAACEDRIKASLAAAAMLKDVKTTVDRHPELSHYSISFTHTPAGPQMTLLLPPDKHAKHAPAPAKTTAAAKPAAKGTASAKKRPATEADDDKTITAGPSVARMAVPKSFKTSETGEDPLSKRILLYISAHAFTGGAWMSLVAILLGVIFSFAVMIRAFMCPDVATDKKSLPAYCPQINNTRPADAPLQQPSVP